MLNSWKESRIYLREIVEEDWRTVHSYASIPSVSQYQPWGPNTEEQSKGYVNQIIREALHQSRTRYAFGVLDRENHQFLGVGELNIRSKVNKQGELSYIVHPDFSGKGLATELAGMLIEYGFDKHHLHRIYATGDVRNVASYRVLEKNAMKKEGRLHEDLLVDNQWRDSYLYAILEQEWHS
ncbi:Protein N-acetyltransferase, RimJ/RimL family [Halobacillus alkaliphilus]|uniref:Protein N-acetyltransferase, RimJ/RimL family n=1 Tax=Halobacillus alkaliphilus TaxID=396056 RepID=A0A1I2PL85_9BACI|nr:GNAT family protein [Halobacillus alkaliphilus]SFG16985.1 Protein N-acetyltransferase, RimJ/RimL family [Halobacillus alkaliphilus]